MVFRSPDFLGLASSPIDFDSSGCFLVFVLFDWADFADLKESAPILVASLTDDALLINVFPLNHDFFDSEDFADFEDLCDLGDLGVMKLIIFDRGDFDDSGDFGSLEDTAIVDIPECEVGSADAIARTSCREVTCGRLGWYLSSDRVSP